MFEPSQHPPEKGIPKAISKGGFTVLPTFPPFPQLFYPAETTTPIPDKTFTHQYMAILRSPPPRSKQKERHRHRIIVIPRKFVSLQREVDTGQQRTDQPPNHVHPCLVMLVEPKNEINLFPNSRGINPDSVSRPTTNGPTGSAFGEYKTPSDSLLRVVLVLKWSGSPFSLFDWFDGNIYYVCFWMGFAHGHERNGQYWTNKTSFLGFRSREVRCHNLAKGCRMVRID